MNRIILQIFAVGILFAVGHSLRCYDCTFGIMNLCITSEKKCDDGEHCYRGVGQAVSIVDITMKGCLKVAECNKTKDVTLPGNIRNSSNVYTMTKTCCSSDLCNAAPGMPRTPGLALTLATITAVFLAIV